MGYNVEAPFSGTEYELATGKMTVFADAKLVEKIISGGNRARAIYNELCLAAEELLRLAKSRKGSPNKENAKLISQIQNLISKWK